MIFSDLKPGQRVRFTDGQAERIGQVTPPPWPFCEQCGTALVHVTFLSGYHRGWVVKAFRPDQLEPAPEDT